MTSGMEFVSLQELGVEAWNAFVDASDEAWFWHRSEYVEALATWPGRHDESFAAIDRGSGHRIVAAVPLHRIEVRRARVIPWSVLDSQGGIATANDLGEAHRKRIVESVRDRLVELARERQAVEVTFALAPMAPAFRGQRCPRVNPLLVLGGENTLTQTWVVDLRRPLDMIRARYSSGAREELRRIAKESVEIREARGERDLATYYDLHRKTYERTGVAPHPQAYFEHIFRTVASSGLARLLFCSRGGNVVAAQSSAFYKDAGIYWTSASAESGKSGETRALIDEQIRYARERGLESFEAGEAFPNAASGKLKGLSDFKRSFGGELFPLYRSRLVTRRRAHVLSESLRAIRS
jgi:hypothetical protein